MTEKYYVVSDTGEYIEYKDDEEQEYYNALLKSFLDDCNRVPSIVHAETGSGNYVERSPEHTELELRRCEKCGSRYKLPTELDIYLCNECQIDENRDEGLGSDVEEDFIGIGKAVLLFYKKHGKFPDPFVDADEILELKREAEDEDFDKMMSHLTKTMNGEEPENIEEFVSWWA